ncbi:hypothetical protein NQZ68_017805 [Dissostichus eleginoides]|nr:hypothetical protein NQZ68_017805 [Dissostichus eleginoides]
MEKQSVSAISPTLGFNIQALEHAHLYARARTQTHTHTVWVVDSADRLRLEDCRKELSSLLLEERLAGATLLVFANKQDLPGALSKEAIQVALVLDDIKSHHWCIIGCSARRQ